MDRPNDKIGPYTLVSKLGQGAFGVVWLAQKQTAIATTQFALKLPRDEDIDVQAFKEEAAIWIKASGHPNVLPLIDADIYEGQVVIVSEYVHGGSLAGWLKQHGGKAPSAETACEIVEGVLAGLAHLHERRIIHRDLKPENILLQGDTPRVADFGIARLLRTTSQSTNVSGTLAYMAPEAFDGKRNERTDIWAVGVIFYQLLGGSLPYDQQDMVSFIGAIMRHDPAPLAESVPEVLRQVVMKALQREPSQRYQSAIAMRQDLREAERILWLRDREAREAREAKATLLTLIPTPIPTVNTDPDATLVLPELPEMVVPQTPVMEVPPTEPFKAATESDEETKQRETEAQEATRLASEAKAEYRERLNEEQVALKKGIRELQEQILALPDDEIIEEKNALILKEGTVAEPTTAMPAMATAEAISLEPIKAPPPEPFTPKETQTEKAALPTRRKLWIVVASLVVIAAVALVLTLWNRRQTRLLAEKRSDHLVVHEMTDIPEKHPTPDPGKRSATKNEIEKELVLIPAGSFMMGSTNGDPSGNLEPVHRVSIRKPFFMAKFEVTQGQWQMVMGSKPSSFKDCGSTCPVESVSWNDAQDFIKKLNEANDRFTYRLPSEAEWEYACRAKTTGDYAGNVDDMAWYDNNSGKRTHPVGQKQPNALGLYDMHGNVWEWCQDGYHDSYNGAPTDGSAWLRGSEPGWGVQRGGAWNNPSASLRSADRNGATRDSRNEYFGFRVVGVARHK